MWYETWACALQTALYMGNRQNEIYKTGEAADVQTRRSHLHSLIVAKQYFNKQEQKTNDKGKREFLYNPDAWFSSLIAC